MKPDLEQLLSDQQDRLRGRRRDWLDDFADWRRNTDLGAVVTVAMVLIAACLMWLSWRLM